MDGGKQAWNSWYSPSKRGCFTNQFSHWSDSQRGYWSHYLHLSYCSVIACLYVSPPKLWTPSKGKNAYIAWILYTHLEQMLNKCTLNWPEWHLTCTHIYYIGVCTEVLSIPHQGNPGALTLWATEGAMDTNEGQEKKISGKRYRS